MPVAKLAASLLQVSKLFVTFECIDSAGMYPDIEQILNTDSSRAIADLAINAIGNEPALFEKAWELMLRDEYPLSMRAARVVDECAERYPLLMEPFLPVLGERLAAFKVEGVKRGMLRFLSRAKVRLSPSLRGRLTETCFDWLSSASVSTAVRFYSMDILFRLSRKEPSIRNELCCVLEDGISRMIFGNAAKPKRYVKTLSKELYASI